MEIKDKILEILIFMTFGNDPKYLFSVSNIEDNAKSCYIGISNVLWYNSDVWGNANGKFIENGRLSYKDEYEQFCKDWVESFLSDIRVRLFYPNSVYKYSSVYDYLRKLHNKYVASIDLNAKFEREFPELYSLCNFVFDVCGNVGEETVGVFNVGRESPLYLLDDYEWLEHEKIIKIDENGCVDLGSFYQFIQRLEDNKDKIQLAKLFNDYAGENVTCSKRIVKLDGGVYEFSFLSWDLWKNKEIEWLEQIGEIKKEPGYFTSFTNLVITGTYEEIETMLELVKGGK